MFPLLDNGVERPSTTTSSLESTDLVRTYLQQTGSKFVRIGTARREPERTASERAQDLWDYLGDFA